MSLCVVLLRVYTAEEFLVRVKLEAAELPDVVEATHIDSRVYVSRQTRYMPAQVSDGDARELCASPSIHLLSFGP